MRDLFLSLIRLGINISDDIDLPADIDWSALQVLAEQHGLSTIVLDGLEKIPAGKRPGRVELLQWIGGVMQEESQYAVQQKVATEMALLFFSNSIRTYVLKGAVVAECYPNPRHRSSVDMDCYLLPAKGDFDAWELGNELILSQGFEVEYEFYKNSTFLLPGLLVENHKFLTPFRGNKLLKSFERTLQSLLFEDKGEDRFEDTCLYRPPVMVTALFLVEHSYSHFLHEGLTWRMVLDWMMFSKKYEKEISWRDFSAYIDEFGLRKFYDSFYQLGLHLFGEIQDSSLTLLDKKMLADVWSPLDVHDNVRGLNGKLALVGNTWRARWKYRYFTEMTWLKALWIQVKGFLFIKDPKLN